MFVHAETTELIEVETRQLRGKEKARRDRNAPAQPAPDRRRKRRWTLDRENHNDKFSGNRPRRRRCNQGHDSRRRIRAGGRF